MSHNTLGNGEWLLVGQSLFSEDGSVELKMQVDGKLAVYYDGQCKFQTTAQQRRDVKGVQMQHDGNLCVYDNAGTAIWHSDTSGNGTESVCVVQNDGNVVIYKGTPVWSTKTNK